MLLFFPGFGGDASIKVRQLIFWANERKHWMHTPELTAGIAPALTVIVSGMQAHHSPCKKPFTYHWPLLPSGTSQVLFLKWLMIRAWQKPRENNIPLAPCDVRSYPHWNSRCWSMLVPYCAQMLMINLLFLHLAPFVPSSLNMVSTLFFQRSVWRWKSVSL